MSGSRPWNELDSDEQRKLLLVMFASFEKPWTESQLEMVCERFRVHDAQVSFGTASEAYCIWWMTDHFVYLDKLFVVPEFKRSGIGSEWFRTWTHMLTPLPVVLRTNTLMSNGFYSKLDMQVIAIDNDQVYMTNRPSLVSASMVNAMFSLPSCFTP